MEQNTEIKKEKEKRFPGDPRPENKRNKINYFFDFLRAKFKRKSFFGNVGSYLITGYPGAGKGVLASHLIQKVDPKKYFFYSNIDEFKCDNVYVFNIDELFQEGKQKFKFSTKDKQGRRLYAVIFDEINLNFNRRINQRKDYVDKFLGLMEFCTTHRHQHVPRVWFLGQKMELQDTQLQSIFKYWADIVGSKKNAPFWIYQKSGLIQFVPKKLKILLHIKGQKNDFVIISKPIKVKIMRQDLENYDDKALSAEYDKLPFIPTIKKS